MSVISLSPVGQQNKYRTVIEFNESQRTTEFIIEKEYQNLINFLDLTTHQTIKLNFSI